MSKVESGRTYGLEIEKPISNKKTGEPHGMSQGVFARLEQAGEQRGAHPHNHPSDLQPDMTLGVVTDDLGEQGVDNGFNLQETAIPYRTDLGELAEAAALDVQTVQVALAAEGATVINMSIHPLGSRDQATYQAMVAPKSVYKYLHHRRWDHSAGIDARAQNSPATGVSAGEAADAVSAVMGAGGAFVGLFGNSPFAEGERTGLKESRLKIWDRMMAGSRVKGDIRTSQFPKERIHTMADYFQWMHGGDSGIHFVLGAGNGQNYKALGDRVLLVDGDPSVLEYLSRNEWDAQFLRDAVAGNNNNKVKVTPDISHMEAMQFAQFAGARIRYGLQQEGFPIQAFVEACKKAGKQDVERIFEQFANYVYIEGRDPGSNLPDEELWETGDTVARSAVMAPSAIQAGLIRNLDESTQLLDKYGWETLGNLREAAIANGLQGSVDGVSVQQLARDVVEVAGRGLEKDEVWMLDYPMHVLRTGKNGADRALDFVDKHGKGGKQALVDLVKSREVVLK